MLETLDKLINLSDQPIVQNPYPTFPFGERIIIIIADRSYSRYTTKHINDESTPKAIKSLLL
jgi:hypothetical protein